MSVWMLWEPATGRVVRRGSQQNMRDGMRVGVEAVEVIDLRDRAGLRACNGTWAWLGLNAGGHDIFECSGGHLVIEALDKSHRCVLACGTLVPRTEHS